MHPRLRFQYFTGFVGTTSDRHDDYHAQLITAEVLLDRATGARDAKLRPIHPGLTKDRMDRSLERPRRGLFREQSPEFLRWYDASGAQRIRPLSADSLVETLIARENMRAVEAQHLVKYHTYALDAEDHEWIDARQQIEASKRPLDGTEYQQLISAIEAAYRGAEAADISIRNNTSIALGAASLVGRLHDVYVASPFTLSALSEAYKRAHAEHLQQMLVRARQIESMENAIDPDGRRAQNASSARKSAEFHANQAGRFDAYAKAVPWALTVRLEMADGREVWWSVMAVDPDGVVNSAVCEAVIHNDVHARSPQHGVASVVGVAIEVHGDDGTTLNSFLLDSKTWRSLEDRKVVTDVYRHFLEGYGIESVVGALRHPVTGLH
jgi:hypothetical protein